MLCEAEYKLFFSRLDYLLGLSPTWVSCDGAFAFAKANGYQTGSQTAPGPLKGDFPYVCGNGRWGIEDARPPGVDRPNPAAAASPARSR